jgi:succinyl-CoA synthetase beta subunit
MEIEELARTEPGAILREYGDPDHGLAPFQARNLFTGLGLPHEQMKPATELILSLARTFIECDCSLIEVNPLALCADGRLVIADLKMAFDDNALRRHPEIAALRDTAQEDPREVEAERYALSYVGLDGNIGCMVNGAGLAMATMDLIRLQGGEPANFLDVGGDATVEKVTAAFRLIEKDERVRAILVNIFGGIVRCDLVANGIVAAVGQAPQYGNMTAGQVGLRAPLVVRLEGANAEAGRKVLAGCGLRITSAESFEDAAAKVVALARGTQA